VSTPGKAVHEAAAMGGIPFKALPWFVIAPGSLLSILAGIGTLAPGRSMS
jgi:hypothetical protein